MTELESFLSQARVCVELDRKCKTEAMLRGDAFNVFDILRLSSNETRQSAFIAELLNPIGCHGNGDVFLKLFLVILRLEGQHRHHYFCKTNGHRSFYAKNYVLNCFEGVKHVSLMAGRSQWFSVTS